MDPSPCNSIGSIRSNDDYDLYATKDKIVRDEKIGQATQYIESSANAFHSKLPSEKIMSSSKNDTFFSGTSGSTREEDITKDDLQAMKDMIGDIKKDPSLLYRLSTLAAGEGPPPAFNLGALGGNGNANNNLNGSSNMFLHSNSLHALSTVRTSIEVDDDHTEVSSLGMMSSDDYNSGKYHNLGHNQNQINQFGQFSPVGGLSQTGAQESMLSRTNRDVEIALRMQSLRAKRGLFNTSQGVVTQYRPPQHQQQSQQFAGQSTGNSKQLNPAIPQSGNAKVSAGYRSSSTPRNQDARPKVEKIESKSSLEELGKMPMKNEEQIHKLSSAHMDKMEAKVPIFFRKQRATPQETEEQEMNLEKRVERQPVSSKQSLVASQIEYKKQKTLTSGATIDKEATESNGGRGQDKNDQEKAEADEDGHSENSALVVYNKEISPDSNPHKGNRKILNEALAPATDARGYNNYALPFQDRDHHVERLDSDYRSAVSKYVHAANGHSSKSKLDRKLDHLNRSSSRSTSRHSENDKKQKARSESIRTVSIERKHSGESTHSRRSAVSERRRSRSEHPSIEKQGRREKSRKPKGSDVSERTRSLSENPRNGHLNYHDGNQRSSSSHLIDGSSSLSSSRLMNVSGDDFLVQPKKIAKDKARGPAGSQSTRAKEMRTSTVSKDYDETENVDKVSSLPMMSFDSSHISLSDYIPPQSERLGDQLHRLNLRHASEGMHHDSESQSGRSVISRISHLVKSKTSKLGSESLCSQSQPSSAHDLLCSDGNSSPKKSIESDDGSVNQKSGRKLISRLSHSRISHIGGGLSSPHQTQRRRTTTGDHMNSSLTPSDWEKNTIRSACNGDFEEPFITNEIGHAFGMRNKLAEAMEDEMARLCDEKGRCVLHPHIR